MRNYYLLKFEFNFMIEKMETLNYLNSFYNNEKDTSKKLKNISLRIKSLENDINTIQVNKNLFNYNKSKIRKVFETDNINESNNIYPKFKSKKLYIKRFLKKKNNFNRIILKKKNIIFNLYSNNNDNANMNLPDKDLCLTEINPHIINRNEKSHLLSIDSTKLNILRNNYKIKKELLHCQNNHYKDLDYKFEIIQYTKKLEDLKKDKKAIMNKIKEIKINSKTIEDKIIKDENKQQMLDEILLLLNKIKNIKENSLDEDIVLNIMDLKYSYEIIKLKNEFINGLKKIMKIEGNNYDEIVLKLNQLAELKKIKSNDCSYCLLNESQKYLNYVQSLLNKFKISNFSELENYIKDVYIITERESNKLEKIKVNLLKGKNSNNYYSNRISKTKKVQYLKKTKSEFNNSLWGNNYFFNNKYLSKSEKIINTIDISDFKFKHRNNNKYIMVSNGKDKIIKVNKRRNNGKYQNDIIKKIYYN